LPKDGSFVYLHALRFMSVAINIRMVGQNRIYTPYMTVYLVDFLPKIPYIQGIFMVLANLIYLVIFLPNIPYIHRIYI